MAVTAIVALAAVAGMGGTAAVVAYGSSCDLDSLKSVNIGANSFVYAADGSLLGSIPAERNREPVTAEGMSLWIRKATIAIEDRRFFQHDGVDVEGIARAAVENLRAGEIVEGGSTITQQLVRNLYISREQTVQRKVKEACLATKLDRARTKQWILTSYLNQSFYGNRAYGIEAAAQTYFSKPARDLTLSQAALLAGLPQAPSIHDPFTAPAAHLRAVRRCCGRCWTGMITPRIDRRLSSASVFDQRTSTGDPRAVLLRVRPRQADRGLWSRASPLRRLKVYTTILPR